MKKKNKKSILFEKLKVQKKEKTKTLYKGKNTYMTKVTS